MPTEVNGLQREKDMEDLANCYEKEYPQSKMGNYSKNQVRELSGETKKVKFLPLRKCDSKTVPLNMLFQITVKVTSDKPSQVKPIGVVTRYETGSGEEFKCKETGSVLSGVHYCTGHDATCRGLSAGVFKAPGGCIEDKIKSYKPNDKFKPLRNDSGRIWRLQRKL